MKQKLLFFGSPPGARSAERRLVEGQLWHLSQWDSWGVPVQDQELELMIPVGAIQLWIFCDSVPFSRAVCGADRSNRDGHRPQELETAGEGSLKCSENKFNFRKHCKRSQAGVKSQQQVSALRSFAQQCLQ